MNSVGISGDLISYFKFEVNKLLVMGFLRCRVHKSDGRKDGRKEGRTDDQHFYVLPKLCLRRTKSIYKEFD